MKSQGQNKPNMCMIDHVSPSIRGGEVISGALLRIAKSQTKLSCSSTSSKKNAFYNWMLQVKTF